MAPKSSATRNVTKKPASVVGRRSVKKSTMNKAASDRRTAKSRRILAALKDVDGVSVELRGQIKKLLARGADSQQDLVQTTLAELKQLISAAEEKLLATLQRSQAAVDGAENDQRARIHVEAQAQERLLNLKRTLTDCKGSLKNSTRMVATSRDTCEKLQASFKQAEAELAAQRSKQDELACAERNLYAPLKMAPVKGAKGHKQLKGLCQVGRECGFNDVLVNCLPAILTKQLDKRRTFDALALQQLDKEFTKLKSNAEANVACKEASVAAKNDALQSAQKDISVAEEDQQVNFRQLTDTEQALEEARAAVLEARKRVRTFKSDAQQSERDLKLARKEISSFQKNAIVAFEELQNLLTPPPRQDNFAVQEPIGGVPLSPNSSDDSSVMWPPTAVLKSRFPETPVEQVTTASKDAGDPSVAIPCSPSSSAVPSATWPATAIIVRRPLPAGQGVECEPFLSDAPSLASDVVS